MNYEKCDFTPIMGMEVEIKTAKHSYKGKLTWRDKTNHVFFEDVLCVLSCEELGFYVEYGVSTKDILSLKATMKPRDMNQEQLHRLAEEMAINRYGDRYESIRSIYHYFDEDGELNDISVDARCHLPDVGAFVIDPNEPVDITHWLKEEE